MTKKITAKEWYIIGKGHASNKWCRPFCVYTLGKTANDNYIRRAYLNWIFYIIIFIPIHLLGAIYYMWDGGLKNMEILKRYITSDYLDWGSESWKRADEIYKNK